MLADIETLQQLQLRYPDTPWPRKALSDAEPDQFGISYIRNGNYGFRITDDGLVIQYQTTYSEDNLLKWGLHGSMPTMCIYSDRPFDIEDALGLQAAVLHSQTVLQSFHAMETAKNIVKK